MITGKSPVPGRSGRWFSEPLAAAVAELFRQCGAGGGSGVPSHHEQSERREWIEHNLARVQMGHALHKRPGEISGGMKQRGGYRPGAGDEAEVLLLDEPFGAWMR